MNGTGILNGSLARKYMNIILPLFIGSVLAYVDRLNIAYAALTMNQDLGFTAKVFGMGAGILFWGYVLFEVPGTLIAHKWSPRKWIARIMITWGLSCALMVFYPKRDAVLHTPLFDRCRGSKFLSRLLCRRHPSLV